MERLISWPPAPTISHPKPALRIEEEGDQGVTESARESTVAPLNDRHKLPFAGPINLLPTILVEHGLRG
jgi:hypothetical protein